MPLPMPGRSSGTLRNLLVAAVLASPTLACRPAETGPPTIQLATWFGSSEAREMAPIVEAINQRHKGEFQVKLVTIPGEYLTKVDTMMAGGVAPDLFLLSQEFIPSYAAIGAIADLDQKIKADPAIPLDDYYPAGLETARYKGKLHGLPWVMMPVVLYYNQALFDAAKQPYPNRDWGWETFRQAAKALTRREADGRATQWGFLQHTWPPYTLWVWQAGGDTLSADGTTPMLDAPQTVDALRFMRQLVVEDQVSPGAGTVAQNGANELFKAGKIAMFMGGASDDLDRMPGLRVGVSEVPHGAVRATFSWTAHLVQSTQSKHPEQAYAAWREVIDGFHHWKIVPPRRSLAKDLAKLEPRKAAAVAPILASMEYARGLRGVVEQSDWDAFVLDRLLLPLLNGRATAEEASAQTQAKLRRVMEVQK